MKHADFDHLVEERIAKIRELINVKGKHYARQDDDRLANFKRGAALIKGSTARALLGPWSKHLVSILNWIDDIDLGMVHTADEWDEKIGDAIVYLILLEAIVKEKTNVT